MPVGLGSNNKKNKIKFPLFFIGMIIPVFLLSLFLWSQQEFDISDAPGALSACHEESPGLATCDKCHNDELEVPPEKCLACHQEIALRISEARGYHQDKSEDCIVCHTEHQGAEEPIVFLDPEDFDHQETGTVLEGAHKEVKDCFLCHRKDNTLPRKKTRSYIFKESGCPVCHTSPHPRRQEKCLTCHNQKNWEVDIWIPGDFP